MGWWKYRKHKIFLFQRRTLLNIPQSIRTGWLLQKQLMAQEVIIVFNLELYTLSADKICVVKNLHARKEICRYWLPENWSLCAAVYEGEWCPSLMFEISWDQRDLLVKSIHNSGYDKNCFFWSPRDDTYYVSFSHIIGLTEVSNIAGRHGQNCCKISAKLFELFNQNLSKLLNRKQ